MKKSIKISSVAVFVLVGAVIFSVKTQAELAKANTSDFAVGSNFGAQKIAPAKNLYVNNCARCHGAIGNGDTELGRLYDTPDLSGGRGKKISRKKAARIIQNGDGSMPSFKKKLTPAEINSLANYIRTL